MLTDEKIREMAENAGYTTDEQPVYAAGAKAAREEMMNGTDTEEIKSKFFATFGEQSFRGYSLDQCNAIWEFFAPHLIDNGK